MRFDYCAFAGLKILKLFTILALIPLVVALYYKEYNSIMPFLYTSLVSLILCFIFQKSSRHVENLNEIRKVEGFGIVISTWLIASLICSIPYLFFGFTPENAFFEGTSGITTTGATILTHFNYPKTLFFWRSFTQWLGGIGILVIFIAVLPQFAVAGRQMFYAEIPGPREEKLTPRIRSTAAAIYKIYLALTLLQILLLKFAGMPWFEGICTSLSTTSCGGFVVKQGLVENSSNAVIWIIFTFLAISGTSFYLIYKMFTKFQPFVLFKNEEFRVYIYTFLCLTAIVASIGYYGSNTSPEHIIRDSAFSVISIMTSGGFASSDCFNWCLGTQIFLILAMFTGASAGSTSGGIKIIRWVYIFKLLKTEITRIFHPNAVINVKSNNAIVPKEVLGQVLIFMFFYFIILAFTALVVTLIENDATKGVMSVINSIGNIGFAPTTGFADFNPVSKFILILDMLIGRLEIIPFLVLFQPEFWKR